MYTKGEYKVESGTFLVRNFHTFVNDAEGSIIAEVYGDSPEQANANAQLFAKAPRMYEAVKRVLEDHRDGLTTLRVSTHAQLLKEV